VKRGYRVNVAEAAALVCGSAMSSGILSLFSAAYGTSADNFVDLSPYIRSFSVLFLMTAGAGGGALFHILVAALAPRMRPFLAKPINFAGRFFVTLAAVFQ
jgi:hypothetical protein